MFVRSGILIFCTETGRTQRKHRLHRFSLGFRKISVDAIKSPTPSEQYSSCCVGCVVMFCGTICVLSLNKRIYF
jgi:hypothetical protein